MADEKHFFLSENLKRLMEDKNLTVTTVAKAVGMNKSTLHNYCNGVVPRNLLVLKDLSDLLGVSLHHLIFENYGRAEMAKEQSEIEGRFEIIIKRLD